MFKKKPLILSVLALAAGMLLSTQAQADTLTLTLDNPTQSGAPGDLLLSFTATVITPGTNTGTIFLNSDSFNLDSPLTLDDSAFVNNFPLFIDPGTSFNGLLFTVSIPDGTPAGPYLGSFSILGGPDGDTLNTLDTANFEVDVASPSAVPEPGTFLLLVTGLSGVTTVVRRKISPTAIQ